MPIFALFENNTQSSRSRDAHNEKAPEPEASGACFKTGGGGGIRTLVTGVAGETVFETAAFNHSATPPQGAGPGPV